MNSASRDDIVVSLQGASSPRNPYRTIEPPKITAEQAAILARTSRDSLAPLVDGDGGSSSDPPPIVAASTPRRDTLLETEGIKSTKEYVAFKSIPAATNINKLDGALMDRYKTLVELRQELELSQPKGGTFAEKYLASRKFRVPSPEAGRTRFEEVVRVPSVRLVTFPRELC